MLFSRPCIATTLLALAIACPCPAAAQQNFQLSSKFYEAEFVRGSTWDGQHRFGNVFCLSFPRPTEAKHFAYALYNDNTLYYSRAMYEGTETTGVFVVTSTVPPGRSVETEIGNLEAQNRESVAAYPGNFRQSRMTGPLGPSLTLTIRNSTAGPKDRIFPFARTLANHPDGQLRTLSVHRLFVRGSDRIEIAGLRYFNAPISKDGEADVIAALSALVESAADSLQSCSVSLPPRAP